MLVRKRKQVRIFLAYFSLPWQADLQKTITKITLPSSKPTPLIRESNFSYLWLSRDTVWIQYCLTYLWAVMLFFHLLTSSPYLSQNCNISFFMIPQCTCSWFLSLWHINFMNELWILSLTIPDMTVEIWNWENSLGAFTVKNR